MNPLNAGLPQRAVAGSVPIGSSNFFTKGPTIVVDESGGAWLAGGAQVLASLYPKAAKLDHLQAHGTAATLAGALPTNQKWRIAGNGQGVFIIAYGNATNVLRSDDGGLTWSTLAAGITAIDVVFEPVSQRFYIFGNTATLFQAQQSTTSAGSAFNAAFSQGPGGGGTVVADTIRAAVRPDTGTIAVRITTSAGNSTGAKVASGAQAFTNTAVPGTSNGDTTLVYNNAGHLVDYPKAAAAFIYTSADDGGTWTNAGNTYVAPTGAGTDLRPIWFQPAGAWFIFGDSGNYWVVASNAFTAANHINYRTPGVRHTGTRPEVVGGYLTLGIKDSNAQNARQLLCTKDGFRWTAKNTSQGIGGANKGLFAADSGAGVIIVPVDDGATQTAALRTPSLDAPLYVGSPLNTDIGSSTSLASLFYKVK